VIHRIRCRLAKAADRRVAHDRLEVAQPRLVQGAFGLEQPDHLIGTFAARSTLTTAFVLEELQQVHHGIFDIVVVRKDDDGVRADEGSHLGQLAAKIERNTRHRRRQYSTRRAARQIGRERMAVEHSTAVIVDELAHRHAGRRLHDARSLDAPRHGPRSWARMAFTALLREPLGAVRKNVADPP
jgi:hypothetical protein